MTYDPNNPQRPASTTRSSFRDRSGNGPMIAAIVGAIVIGLGILFYALNNNDRIASTTTEPPTTTGQSPTTTGQSQKAPSPAPVPAPSQKSK